MKRMYMLMAFDILVTWVSTSRNALLLKKTNITLIQVALWGIVLSLEELKRKEMHKIKAGLAITADLVFYHQPRAPSQKLFLITLHRLALASHPPQPPS